MTFWATNPAGFDGAIVAPNLWDRVRLGGYLLPGVCKIRGAPSLDIDKQKKTGTDVTTLILRGYSPSQIDIECVMWTPDQWTEFERIARAIWRKPNKPEMPTNTKAQQETAKARKAAKAAQKKAAAAEVKHTAATAELAAAEKEAAEKATAEAEAAKKAAETAEKASAAELATAKRAAIAGTMKQAAVKIASQQTALWGVTDVVVMSVSLPEEGPIPQSRVVRIKCLEYVPSPEAAPSALRRVGGSQADVPMTRSLTDAANDSEKKEPSAHDGGP